MDFEPHAVANQHQVSGQNRQVLFMLGFMVANKIHTNIPPPSITSMPTKSYSQKTNPSSSSSQKGIPEWEELIAFVDLLRLSLRDVLSTKLS